MILHFPTVQCMSSRALVKPNTWLDGFKHTIQEGELVIHLKVSQVRFRVEAILAPSAGIDFSILIRGSYYSMVTGIGRVFLSRSHDQHNKMCQSRRSLERVYAAN